jgi:hypothetical protein
MSERKQHPSGRPITRPVVKREPVWRVPDYGYVIPRLRPENRKTEAIGFYAPHQVREDED